MREVNKGHCVENLRCEGRMLRRPARPRPVFLVTVDGADGTARQSFAAARERADQAKASARGHIERRVDPCRWWTRSRATSVAD